jgi:hypothetical protein
MPEKLEQLADTVRTAVCGGDFVTARAALDAYTSELRRVAEDTTDRKVLSALESRWKDLADWARLMALTARELARDEWVRLPAASPYRGPDRHHTATISARG